MITSELKKRLVTSFFLILILLIVIKSNFFLGFCLIVLSVLSILEFLNIIRKIINNKIVLILLNTFFILYVFSFSTAFFHFSNFLNLKIILFVILSCCIASDIGGFIIGKKFKGPKLTKISPNKTINGSLGSIIFSIFIFSGLCYYFTNNFSYKFILVAIIISLANQFGDLLFSYLKRRAKMKNTGNILPGHGGILDRLDGIYLGLPVGFTFIILIF
tara:strand:+ start:623 stop:1273 length:651 start_codon:yes stop_codon:yes gene_type:complete